MLARLKDRFTLLKGGWKDLPERHRTLKATIDWSFDLLEPEENRVVQDPAVLGGDEDVFALADVALVQVARDEQPIAEVAEIGVQSELPGVAVGLNHLGLP